MVFAWRHSICHSTIPPSSRTIKPKPPCHDFNNRTSSHTSQVNKHIYIIATGCEGVLVIHTSNYTFRTLSCACIAVIRSIRMCVPYRILYMNSLYSLISLGHTFDIFIVTSYERCDDVIICRSWCALFKYGYVCRVTGSLKRLSDRYFRAFYTWDI